MFLHLGQDTVVRTDEVIGIFDIETASVGKITRQFLSHAEKELRVTNVSQDLPKSFVVCLDEGGTRVYISQISTATLRRRTAFVEELGKD